MRNFSVGIVMLGMAQLLVHAQGPGKKIDGNWALTDAISRGEFLPAETIAKTMGKLNLKAGTYEQSMMGAKVESGKFKIDVGKKPATIDLDIREGNDKGKIQLGIFKMEGDILTIAVSKAGSKERPKTFAGAADVEILLYKRGK